MPASRGAAQLRLRRLGPVVVAVPVRRQHAVDRCDRRGAVQPSPRARGRLPAAEHDLSRRRRRAVRQAVARGAAFGQVVCLRRHEPRRRPALRRGVRGRALFVDGPSRRPGGRRRRAADQQHPSRRGPRDRVGVARRRPARVRGQRRRMADQPSGWSTTCATSCRSARRRRAPSCECRSVSELR